VDLHMAEGITSMAMQQGGLGLILSVLIITVPQMTAQFFMGALGQFMHYSNFGGTDAGNAQPGPQGQPTGSYQSPVNTDRSQPAVNHLSASTSLNNTTTYQGPATNADGDVVKRADIARDSPKNRAQIPS
jgi:type IV secretion system protein VirB6